MRIVSTGGSMPRFHVGMTVRIRGTISTPHTNKVGVIIKVLPHKRNIRTLDRYVVAIPGGLEINLWDIQLESAHAVQSITVVGR